MDLVVFVVCLHFREWKKEVITDWVELVVGLGMLVDGVALSSSCVAVGGAWVAGVKNV